MGKSGSKCFKEKSFTREPQREETQDKDATHLIILCDTESPHVRSCIDFGSKQAVIQGAFLTENVNDSNHADP